jgi:hypothetical protein
MCSSFCCFSVMVIFGRDSEFERRHTTILDAIPVPGPFDGRRTEVFWKSSSLEQSGLAFDVAK